MGHVLVDVKSRNTWSSKERLLEIPVGEHGTAGVLLYASKGAYSVLKLGFDSDFNPMCLLGGPAWGPAAASYVLDGDMDLPDKFILRSKWLDIGDNDWVVPGQRLWGLRTEKFRTKVSIQEGSLGDQAIWIVDIEQLDNHLLQQGRMHERIYCNGCGAQV